MGRTFTIGRRTTIAGAVLALAGCQPPTAPASPLTLKLGAGNTGYMLFAAVINAQSYGLFTREIGRMLDLDSREIHIAMNSPGGGLDSAEAMIAYMDRIHAERGVTFVTHNIGLVASAACYVFLAGQRRLTNPGANFLFHEAGLQANGVLTGQVLQDASEQLRRHERFFLGVLKSRTKLTDGEALSFIRRTVILTAPEARRDGIVDTIAPFTPPKDATIDAIASRPNPATTRQATAPRSP